MLCPFFGSIIALIFYEVIFVKTQEYLNDESEEEEDDEEESESDKPINKSKKTDAETLSQTSD